VTVPEILTTKEAAAEVHVAEATIRKWVARGLLTVAGRSGRSNCYWRSELLEADRLARRGRAVAKPS